MIDRLNPLAEGVARLRGMGKYSLDCLTES
jgi:hypothetical protein